MKNKHLYSLLLISMILTGIGSASAQTASGRFDYFLTGNLGVLINQNTEESLFKPKPAVYYSGELTARYYLGTLGISVGFEAANFSVAQKMKVDFIPDARQGFVRLQMNYLALTVPVRVHYFLTDRLDLNAGVNVLWLNWMSCENSMAVPASSEISIVPNNDIANWQTSWELALGAGYRLSDRFNMGVSVARSLQNVCGMGFDVDFSSSDFNGHFSSSFDYSWTRITASLAYRLNK